MPLKPSFLSRFPRPLLCFATAFCCCLLLLCSSAALVAEEGAEQLFTDEQWAEASNRSSIGTKDGDARSQGQEGQVGASLVRMVFGLVAVIAVALLIAWLVRRSGLHRRLPGQRGEHLEVVESLSLGPKRGVSLLRVGGQFVLVGHNEQNITALGNFQQVDGVEPPAAAKAEASSSSETTPAQPSPDSSLSSMVAEGDQYVAHPESNAPSAQEKSPVDDFRQRLNRLLGGRS